MIVWAWCSLAWVASVAFWVIVVFARERRLPRDYHQLCETLGLCALWPVTVALEFALERQSRRAEHDRKTRQATPEV